MRVGERRSKEEPVTKGVGGEGACPFCYFVDEEASWGLLEFLPLTHCNK